MTDQRTFGVELSIQGSGYIEVLAMDEDEARDAARDAWRDACHSGDVEIDTMQVESVQELGA